MSTRETGIPLDSFSFRPESETYLARYDEAETSASMAVVATVAAVLDTDPTEMDQLYYSIDAEALDELLAGSTAADGDVRVEFTFEGHAVAVTDTEVIAARASDADNGH
ncbi:HalOD1 output domain-containing protein, partial [Halorubrum pallidum]